MKEAEKVAALNDNDVDQLDAMALVWLYSSSSNPTVASVTVQAISGLRFGFLKPARDTLKNIVTFRTDSVEDVLLKSMDYDNQHGRLGDDRLKVERFLRACHQLRATLPDAVIWLHTKGIFCDTADAALKILYTCHTMLNEHPWDFLREREAPIALLESYSYRSEKPIMRVTWWFLLRRCRHGHFETPLKRWCHGMRVMHSFSPSYDSSNDLRRAMLLEYFCSLSQDSIDHTSWGKYSAFAGLPLRIEKVLPQIYTALSEAMRVFCTHSTLGTELDNKEFELQSALPRILAQIFGFIARALRAQNVDPVDQEAITKAASALRLEMQKLLELEGFWKNDSEESSKQRSELCNLLAASHYWPRWIPPSSWQILWTPELMDCFLRSYDWSYSWADSSFREGNSDVYRLFEERDGLSKVKWKMHWKWLCTSYLEGLTGWKDDPDDQQRHINTLFVSNNFAHIADESIVKKQDDGTYKIVNEVASPYIVATLFRIRSPDPESYGDYLEPLLGLMKARPDLWPPKPAPTGAELEVSDSENKPRWNRFFSTGGGTLLSWIPCREDNDPRRGAEAA